MSIQKNAERFSVGVDDIEGPPVPIPNTVVKLSCAEDTWLEAARENRTMPTQSKATAQEGGCFFVVHQYYKNCTFANK